MGMVDLAPPPADRTTRTLDLLCLGSFVVLGLPDGMLGTAWPSMRQGFGAPVADLGLILLVTTAGAAVVSAFVGRMIRRIGIPTLLAIALMCAGLGAAGFALAPGLWLVLAVSVLVGAAAGMMDGGLNTAVGLSGRSRLLNLLHGSYGVGTAIGPLLVTAAVLIGSWRPAYGVLVLVDVMIALLWIRQRRIGRGEQGTGSLAVPPAAPLEAHPSDRWSRRRSAWVVVTGMTTFFVYTGLEVAAGQWEASFGRGHLGLSAAAAGLATFCYWGALTGARFALALLPRPIRPVAVVHWGSALAIVATAAIWWQPDEAVTLAAFVVLGAALAGVFPALISLTPARIGEKRARDAIAWQVGAAAAGGSAVSAMIGLLIGAFGYSVLGPSLTVLAILLVGGNVILSRVVAHREVATT
jgi:fucose permease